MNVNLRSIHPVNQYNSITNSIISENSLDTKHYRLLVNYKLKSNVLSRKANVFDNYLTGNAASKYKVHTIIGYEPSLNKNIVKSLNLKTDYPDQLYGSQYILSEENINILKLYNIKYIISNTMYLTPLFDKLNISYSLVKTKTNMYLYILKNTNPIVSTYSNPMKVSFNGEYLYIENLPMGKTKISYHCYNSSLHLKWYSNNNDVELLCINSLLQLDNKSKIPQAVKLEFHWVYSLFFIISLIVTVVMIALLFLDNKIYLKRKSNFKGV